MEINEYEDEYKTVERLSSMLEYPKEEHEITESYALFTAILCWVTQRIRKPDDQEGAGDSQAQSIEVQLSDVMVSEEPWEIDGLDGMSVFKFFKHLRNAVAHGDNRRIRPLNDNGELKGYSFELRCRKGKQYIDTVNLFQSDMQRLGGALADRHCQTLKSDST